MTKCAYHPEAEAIGACVNCGWLVCAEFKTILSGKIYCNQCADKMLLGSSIPAAQVEEKATYNTALRVISAISGVLFILAALTGLSYFAESGLVTELIVDIITIIVAIACLLLAFAPQWVSANLRSKLEKGSVFAFVLCALIIVFFVATALGPEPPGGWLNY